jgi:peptidoglycan/xylan/chitin deacetylase (PgdA/CDA1 family)
MIPVALAFHAEKLHDEHVWRRVERIARWTAQKDIKATFFVYPFRAQVVGKDITDRVRTLAALGHEIGQHTHFYAGTKVDKGEKVDDLSEANIAHCLYRDFETLQQMGVLPRGFTAGAWFVNPTVLDRLVELGFSYDCSAQFPKRRELTLSPYHRWLWSPQFHSNTRGQILCLPTTCSLGEWFKGGRRLTTGGKVPYQLIYLHDYDLLTLRNYLALSCFLKIFTRQTLKPLATLVREYPFQEGERDVAGSCKQV